MTLIHYCAGGYIGASVPLPPPYEAAEPGDTPQPKLAARRKPKPDWYTGGAPSAPPTLVHVVLEPLPVKERATLLEAIEFGSNLLVIPPSFDMFDNLHYLHACYHCWHVCDVCEPSCPFVRCELAWSCIMIASRSRGLSWAALPFVPHSPLGAIRSRATPLPFHTHAGGLRSDMSDRASSIVRHSALSFPSGRDRPRSLAAWRA